MKLTVLLKIVSPFFLGLIFIITIVLLPPWPYVLNKYFVMSNTTLIGLTYVGQKQERLVLPLCVEKIDDHAFSNNHVLKVVHLSWSLKQISLNAFDNQIIWKNLTFFYAPNQKIIELLNSVGIPNSQICCYQAEED